MNISYVAILKRNMDNFTFLHYTGKKQQSNLTCLSPRVNHPKEMKEIPSKTKAPNKFQNFEQKLQPQINNMNAVAIYR